MTAAPNLRPRRTPKYSGLFHDEIATDSYWIRERGTIRLPPLGPAGPVVVTGTVLAADPAAPWSGGELGLRATLGEGAPVVRANLPAGDFRLELAVPESATTNPSELGLELLGVGRSNLLAWLGRVTGFGPWQPWRTQARNRRLRIRRIEAGGDKCGSLGGEVLVDFSNRAAPWNTAFARRHAAVGLNIAGFFRADLGIGESARCMARAADATGVPVALVDLKLPCKNPLGDDTFAARLQPENPHPVNVFHLDAPAAFDLDHHHGDGFRRGRYNIGYWAWELPEFPDAWAHYGDFFDEVWAPSRFAAEAIAEKVLVPVLAMPHAISFNRPQGDFRGKFGLPADKFLFLFLYDLNSYSERKNPAAVLDAFRRSGLAGRGAALVIKVHGAATNGADLDRLRAACADLPGTVLLAQTLKRAEVYELESACDCFVSLHRSEGFGLAVAECMYLGKPVIATDWSATAEYLDATNGFPVRCRLVTLDRHHGPYAKGSTWAEPDTAHAAECMQCVHADAGSRERLGTAARATIEEKFAPAVIGARYRRRLAAIADR